MPSCLVGLGSNLGDRSAQLNRAVQQLGRVPGIEVRSVSSWHETEPVGGPPGQGEFLNGALLAESSRSPSDLLQTMLAIERQLGRAPHARWNARLIDLDLLLYGDEVLSTDSLTVPHPWMAIRRFVLEPCCEIAPTMVHPTIGWSVRRLLGHISRAEPYIAVTGVPGTGKSTLIRHVLSQVSGRLMDGTPPPELAVKPNANSAGSVWDTEIEFVRYRAKLVDRCVWPVPSMLAISDFWFRQSLAYGQLWLSESQQEDLSGIVSRQSAHEQPQKLLVLLEAPRPWLDSRIVDSGEQKQGDLSAEQRVQLQHYLRAQVDRPGHGPVLRLDARDMQRATSDVVTAVAAMT